MMMHSLLHVLHIWSSDTRISRRADYLVEHICNWLYVCIDNSIQEKDDDRDIKKIYGRCRKGVTTIGNVN